MNSEERGGGLEHLAEALKDPSYVCECIIALLSLLYVSKEKTDQVISVIQIKLALRRALKSCEQFGSKLG